MRFTPPGGEVTRDGARPEASGCRSSVTDTGVGIAPEHLPRVVRALLSRRPARSRDDGGTGIGLAIARSIVEAHGGRIVAKSEPGHGSAFTFDLPAVEAAVAADDRRVHVKSATTDRHRRRRRPVRVPRPDRRPPARDQGRGCHRRRVVAFCAHTTCALLDQRVGGRRAGGLPAAPDADRPARRRLLRSTTTSRSGPRTCTRTSARTATRT